MGMPTIWANEYHSAAVIDDYKTSPLILLCGLELRWTKQKPENRSRTEEIAV